MELRATFHHVPTRQDRHANYFSGTRPTSCSQQVKGERGGKETEDPAASPARLHTGRPHRSAHSRKCMEAGVCLLGGAALGAYVGAKEITLLAYRDGACVTRKQHANGGRGDMNAGGERRI